jgi:beta-N-acetylhexosaminidase
MKNCDNHSERLGLRFIVEPQGAILSTREKELLAELQPLGVMFRRRNFRHDLPYSEWLATYQSLVAEIRAAIGREDIIFCIDHEGGSVHRFPSPITRFPYAMTYGESLPAVQAVSRAMAVELKSLGINVTFSPVADVHSNPKNPVINQRAYSSRATSVAEAAVVSAREFRAHGIIPCAKHFPGHGDTTVDSHFELPVVSRNLNELEQCELIPFKALIEDNVEMIMTAHLMVPELDSLAQATISAEIITHLMRSKLGYKGVTIADALGMKAILQDVRSGSFSGRAQRAGLDIFLVAGDVVTIEDAMALKNELFQCIQTDDRIALAAHESEERIVQLLARVSDSSVQMLSDECIRKHSDICVEIEQNHLTKDFDFSPEGFE